MAEAAGELFRTQGYQNVGIEQIGAAVGLTGPAVYRHFKGKHDILVAALMRQTRIVEELGERADNEGTTPLERLDLLLDGFGDLTAERDEATLWRREQRHLEPEQREVFRTHFSHFGGRIAASIMGVRPELAQRDAELLGFAVLTMYSNTSGIRGKLTPDRLKQIQSTVARAIVGCYLPERDADSTPPEITVHRRPAGRRERILAAAADLFDERGFYDVRIDDIAAAAQISVSTFYQSADSKSDVLRAILKRGAEGLLYVTADALAPVREPQEVLGALIDTYIRQAMGLHGRIMKILATDLLYLSEEEQAALQATQREYVAEWEHALLARSDRLTGEDARSLAKATIGVITDISQTPEYREQPAIVAALTAIAHAMVLPGGVENRCADGLR
ncbi:TetR/AcrR family transcriptional regulator [Nocardia jinanensis]|uniref:TetR/AcrR family transcriptional regulator n=1 Tax=Nocardia jinanensis TaxID=382504 RepID=UPI0007385E16|nr:TetR/AcrR family transcriptional regulator [Nocardia jinanensis]